MTEPATPVASSVQTTPHGGVGSAAPAAAVSTLAKVALPRGNRPIARQRLFDRLDRLREAGMVWIASSPGSGKTTLLSSYLTERGLHGVWLQLDADDGEPATFFHYLKLAVAQATGSDPGLPALTPAYLSGLMTFTRRFAETIGARLAAPALIVLDNYEQIAAHAVLHEVVAELASSLPQGIQLVVLSRADPPPVYARLRLNERLAVLEAEALNLTLDEAANLSAARNGPHGDRAGEATGVRTGSSIEQLLSTTHGWVAGFTLLLVQGVEANNSADSAGSAGDRTQQLLFDYFASEFFMRLQQPLRQALLRTAPLPTMTLADAAHLSGDPAIGSVLVALHRQNCFVVRRGEAPAVYEYHALFRAFLLDRAAAEFDAAEWRSLQGRAGDLLAAAGQPEVAAGLYRAAGEHQRLAQLALAQAPALMSSGRHRTLSQWIGALPDALLRRSALLQYWRGAAELPFDPIAARNDFTRAYAAFKAAGDAVGLYTTWAAAMETFFYEWRDFRLADVWIDEYQPLRAAHPQFPSRAVELRTYWAMGTLMHRQPWHPLLPAWAARAQALLDASDRDLSVLLGGYLVIWFLWRSEAAEAAGVIARVDRWIDPDMTPMVLILWSCAIAMFESVRGNLAACRQAADSGLRLAQRSGLHGFDFLLCAQMARGCLLAGDPPEAQTWIETMSGNMRRHSHIDGAFHLHLRANLALQRRQWQAALECAQGAMTMVLESGVPFLEAHCHIDLARIHLKLGDAGASRRHIAAARVLADAMDSRLFRQLCDEAEANDAFAHSDDAEGRACLARALAASRTMNGATWQMAGPKASVELYERALAAGIETDHVRQQIRRHRLAPADPVSVADAWPWPVRLTTLGRFEIQLDGEPLRSAGKAQHRPLELLKCLCALGGQAVLQDRIADALWPAADGDAADQALRTTLHRLRKLLRNEQALRLEDRHLHLDTRCVWADCLAFERAAHDPRSVDKLQLQQALSRYQGPFLPGESAPWATACRDRLHTRFLRLTERLHALLEADGDWSGVVDCSLRAIEVDPTAEVCVRRLMAGHARMGRRAEALLAYQRCRQALLARLGVSPAPETQALYRELGGT